MIVETQQSKWLVVQNRTPLLYTASNHKESAIKKYENKERITFQQSATLKCICADITVKDLEVE